MDIISKLRSYNLEQEEIEDFIFQLDKINKKFIESKDIDELQLQTDRKD